MSRPSLSNRVQAWDQALQAVRAYFRGQGLREVLTPVRLPEVAIEPYIEPVRATGGLLATSPELPMKQLLSEGAGDIFQVAPVFRAAEQGRLHREGFHLIEWYRCGADEREVRADVERLIDVVFTTLGRAPVDGWSCVAFLPLLESTTSIRLRGDENADMLAAATPASWCVAPPDTMPAAARDLFAWSALLTSWSDTALDPWLAEQPGGVHVLDYPAPLAALAQLGPARLGGGVVAQRFESYIGGVELSNGYHELRDVAEQRARFERVIALRAGHGEPPLPMPERFLAALQGLPPCAGAALGFERLLMLATGSDRLRDISIEPL
ncbi:MAG: amino acid--tRNA ligase-related protein [Nannocystales bacterium]